MDQNSNQSDVEAAADLGGVAGKDQYVLRLFVAGQAPMSARAVANITEICETHLQGRYMLEVIDLYQDPGRAQVEQIIAVPTLVKDQPEPRRRIVGDLSHTQRVLATLGVATQS